MVFDIDYYYSYSPSYYTYSRPRYYTSYVPSYLGDRYYSSYRYYRPLYWSPTSYARTRAYLPYVPSIDYKYGSYTSLSTAAALARAASPVYPETISTRYTRASSLEPTYSTDLDYYSARRAASRARLMSEEPLTSRTITTRTYYY